MNRTFLFLMSLGLVSCGTYKEQYYSTHYKALQKAIKACPHQAPQGISCHEIDLIAVRMGKLVYQLQADPQAFGKEILMLQERIAAQRDQLKADNSNQQLRLSLKQDQQNLRDKLTVVKWFESPDS